MIVSFKHKGLERFFKTGSLSGIQAGHSVKLNLLLTALNAAQTPRIWLCRVGIFIPSRAVCRDIGRFKVNGNWRLTFRFNDGNVEVVDYQDYH